MLKTSNNGKVFFQTSHWMNKENDRERRTDGAKFVNQEIRAAVKRSGMRQMRCLWRCLGERTVDFFATILSSGGSIHRLIMFADNTVIYSESREHGCVCGW